MAFRLLAINNELTAESLSTSDPQLLADVVAASREIYSSAGAYWPWICYLAEADGKVIGTCGFKTPPCNGITEIAYFTFPGHESKGFATSMGRALLEISERADQAVQVVAQTLPQRNASHRVLEKLGFRAVATIQHPEDGAVLEWHANLPR